MNRRASDTKAEAPAAAAVLLSPCPFCGEKKLLEMLERIDSKLFENHWVYCRRCSCSGPIEPQKEKARERWNLRALVRL